jgi:putative hydroxymethylpyrimidine transporter CytX
MDIKPVESSAKRLGGFDFFLLWAGVAISLAEIWAGGFLAPMGFWMGFWAIILGHVIGNTFMALGGVVGSDHGIMSMVSVRPSFGIRGSNLAAFFNILQLVGWASIMLIIGGRAGAILGKPLGGLFATNQFWIILIGLGTLLWAFYTGKTIWKIMQTTAVIALLLVSLVMSYVSFEEFGSGIFKGTTGAMSFMIGLDLVIAMPISWMPLVADYSRFGKRSGPTFWNTWWGYFIVSSWMYLLGLAATIVTGAQDPGALILEIMGRVGLAVPALVLVVFSTITSDFPDIYSATCSMMNITKKISAKAFMWFTGILSIVVALFFPMEQYENFLFFIGAMFVPLFGVVLTDYFLIRKRQLKLDEIDKPGGAYWYWKGFNPSAIMAWAAGFLTYEAIALMKLPVGGSIPSILVSGTLYLLIFRER